ncbi:hypothetical protein PAL_GLEAN10024662 [Pteropus alecto]|uniref:Uncharacterized protein n=1 Tax=Pteropus alecto TaxID=9402 RepID=L5JYI2_PTEAL|nr:hypothetical protein PAL_GLEAN10024662 [Pteropus alecto]
MSQGSSGCRNWSLSRRGTSGHQHGKHSGTVPMNRSERIWEQMRFRKPKRLSRHRQAGQSLAVSTVTHGAEAERGSGESRPREHCTTHMREMTGPTGVLPPERRDCVYTPDTQPRRPKACS